MKSVKKEKNFDIEVSAEDHENTLCLLEIVRNIEDKWRDAVAEINKMARKQSPKRGRSRERDLLISCILELIERAEQIMDLEKQIESLSPKETEILSQTEDK